MSALVRSLERRLGAPLLMRTTRSISITEAGRIYLEHAKRALGAAQEADESVLATN